MTTPAPTPANRHPDLGAAWTEAEDALSDHWEGPTIDKSWDGQYVAEAFPRDPEDPDALTVTDADLSVALRGLAAKARAAAPQELEPVR